MQACQGPPSPDCVGLLSDDAVAAHSAFFVSYGSETKPMLRCTMNTSLSIRLGLEDLLADLQHARKHAELGRLALLAYCEVRGWARQAGEAGIAEQSTLMFTANPCVSKDEFLSKVDALIGALQQLHGSVAAVPHAYGGPTSPPQHNKLQ